MTKPVTKAKLITSVKPMTQPETAGFFCFFFDFFLA
jgi:hypothetical protein